jgi:hypothetical protein
MKKIIEVNRGPGHLFPKKFEDEYGKFSINDCNQRSYEVNRFSLNDLIFLQHPYSKKLICGSEFEAWIKKQGFVPLDIFQARTIFSKRETLKALIEKWRQEWWELRKPNFLATINFFGSTTFKEGGDGVFHIPCFKLARQCCCELEEMVAYENTKWMGQNDFALVFKKEFIKQLGI